MDGRFSKSTLSGRELCNEPRTSCKSKKQSRNFLDPRTKLAVLITIAVFILGGSYEGIMQYYIIVLAAIPLLLLSAARKWKGTVLYILIFGGSLCLEMFGLSRLTGVANYIAVAVVGILLRFTPSVVMGYFVVTTTTVSEFVAAMERLHLPQQITIPMSVMFRFFPTVAEEWSAIGDAMRMRGVRFGGGKASAILEYRIVPMMICSVKIGEELSQAALTRGLGGPVKRTNICKLGFHVQDVIFLLICLGAFAAQIYVLAARG
ncbi:energy-coupling factor transporter transmembrane component T [[Ruminococcus] torques]|uniref:energy-coupling factor transporter transmembrane component T n=1 Tax=[Ruminococcus] torques TaxID=33039 RepID=UPI00399B2A2A